MVFKIIGAVLIIASSSGLGVCLSNQWKERLMLMEQLRKMILMLKGEILYANAPLEEAFWRVGEKGGSRLGKLFSDVSVRIGSQCGEPFYTLWKEEIYKLGKETLLLEKDKQELTVFGEHLGYLDCEMQERTIQLYLEQLGITIDYLREHQREKSRLYTTLGIMGGLFLTIVMC